MNTARPFRIEEQHGTHVVLGPNGYRYVCRGARSAEHADTWARRLNEAYAMGYQAGEWEGSNGRKGHG